jgi:hypothetical protein
MLPSRTEWVGRFYLSASQWQAEALWMLPFVPSGSGKIAWVSNQDEKNGEGIEPPNRRLRTRACCGKRRRLSVPCAPVVAKTPYPNRRALVQSSDNSVDPGFMGAAKFYYAGLLSGGEVPSSLAAILGDNSPSAQEPDHSL